MNNWNKIELGIYNGISMCWDVTLYPILFLSGHTGSGKTMVTLNVISQCINNYDIHCIDTLHVEWWRNNHKNITTYTDMKQVSQCFDTLLNTEFEKPQLVIIENIYEIISKYNSSFDEIVPKLLKLLDKQNIYFCFICQKYDDDEITNIIKLKKVLYLAMGTNKVDNKKIAVGNGALSFGDTKPCIIQTNRIDLKEVEKTLGMN
jgi:Cdc6-like AAA superfamily ATPase